MHLFEYHSVGTSATDNRNAKSTGFYWLEKVFLVLGNCQDGIALSNEARIDETYVQMWKSRRKRKYGLECRGLPRNQCCICCGTDWKT